MVWARGPVCSTCYYLALEAKAICAGCGQLRRPDPRDLSGRCADCVGLAPFQVCAGCGVEDRIYRHGRCWRCTLADAFDTATGTTPDNSAARVDLTALRASLLATDRPRAVVRWLATPFAADTLARLATGELAMTHQAIDTLGDTLAVARLRAELVTAGLLGVRDEAVARLEAWTQRQLDAIADVEDRRTVEAFATWWVLRRVRTRSGTRLPTASAKTARRQIAHAVEFVAFVRANAQTLATCTQADVDLWLNGPPSRRHARAFVRWAHRRGLCSKLEITNKAQAWPTRQLAPGVHEQMIHRLLTDPSISLVDRVSGLLVGCYGQLPARLVRLSVDDVTIVDTTVAIRFGRDPVTVIDPVAVLVAAYVETRRGRAATDVTAGSRWLFPGGFAGRPLDPETLASRLRQLGISSIKLRTDVLLDLAADIPPAILADLIGLYPTTAARWTHAAGGDWANYVAERTRRTYAARRATPCSPPTAVEP